MDGISSNLSSTTLDALTGATPSSRTHAASTTTVSAGSSTTASAQSDSITISAKSAETARYIADARVLPPLNEQTIQKLKTAISHGNYPPPALIEGLINLVGSGVTEPAPSGE